MEIPLLPEIVTIFGLSIAVLLLCHRLKIPTIVGYLVTGILSGPQGLGLVSDIESVQILSRVGIALLLLTVGLEFSVKKILLYKRFFFIAGPLQVIMTCIVGFIVGQLLNRPMGESLFLGFLLSLSSTAIVLRIYDEKGESATPHGKLVLGTLIFQDIIVVLMVLITPILGKMNGGIDWSFLTLIGKGILILLVVFVTAERIVPRLLYYVAKTRSKELFLLTVIVICFSVAWVASAVGLSISLGAFLAGLIISESEYSVEAIGDILPFQNIFTSFFFVSVGMLLDFDFILQMPLLILVTALAVFLIKGIIATLAGIIIGVPLRTAMIAGLSLAQVGEFSFILAKVGMANQIATSYHYQLFLAVTFLTMAATPFVIQYANKIVELLLKLPFPQKIKLGYSPMKYEKLKVKKDHAVIIGYGLSGRNVARCAREADIPYAILDLNAERVREERQMGEPIFFGDATHYKILKHIDIQNASVVAVLVNDPLACFRIVENVRHLNPTAYIVVRTRYLEEMKPLYQLGADDVIPDEFGTSIEVMTRIMMKFNKDFEKIEHIVSEFRAEGYEMLRLLYREPHLFTDIQENYTDFEVVTARIKPTSIIVGKTLEKINFEEKYGVRVIMIRRKKENLWNFTRDIELLEGDLIVIIGKTRQLKRAMKILKS